MVSHHGCLMFFDEVFLLGCWFGDDLLASAYIRNSVTLHVNIYF